MTLDEFLNLFDLDDCAITRIEIKDQSLLLGGEFLDFAASSETELVWRDGWIKISGIDAINFNNLKLRSLKEGVDKDIEFGPITLLVRPAVIDIWFNHADWTGSDASMRLQGQSMEIQCEVL